MRRMATVGVAALLTLGFLVTVSSAGTFSPPGRTTAVGQPAGTAGPDEPIETTPPGKTDQPAAVPEPKPAAEPEPKPEAEPEPKPEPAMSDETFKRLLAEVKKAVLQGLQTNAQKAKAFEKTANAAGDKRMQIALLEEAARHGLAGVPDSTCCDVVGKALGRLETLAADRAGEWGDLRIEFYRRWYRGTSKAAKKRYPGARLLEFVLADAGQCEEAREWAKAAEAYGEAVSIASFLKRRDLKAISQRHTRARHLAGVQRKVRGYMKVLANSPDNVAVRLRLLTTLVVDLDDPAKAVGHLADDVGPYWNRYVPLAAQPVARVAVGDCKELGDWYYKLLLKQAVSSYSKENVLGRAKMYYECSLEKPGLPSTGKLLVKVDLAKVQGQLQKLPKPAVKFASPDTTSPKLGEWIDVLKLVDPRKHTVSGAWERRQGDLVCTKPVTSGSGGTPRIIIPVRPLGNYELLVQFERISGNDIVGIILPLGQTGVRLTLSSAGGSCHGLAKVDDKPARENSAAVRPGTLVNGNPYEMSVSVIATGEEVHIAAKLDETAIIDWMGLRKRLSVSRLDLVKQGYLALAVRSPTAFKSVKLRMLSGEAKVVTEQAEPKEEDEWIDLLALPDKLSRSSATPTQDGIRIGKLSTVQPVAVPFVAEFVAKTNSTNIRLAYGDKGVIIFNWEVRRGDLRFHDFRTGRVWGFRGRGQVPVNKWVRISLAVSETRTEVFVNGHLRGKLNGNYKGLSKKLSIRSSHGSVVTVKAFRLRKSPPSVR